MVKKYFFILVLIVLSAHQLNAQIELQKIAPLSPNTAGLFRLSETNISHYTGVPGISLPIYSIQSRSLRLDLNLTYNSTGNKVEDISSWVGLGWNMTTIPVVTRSVRSLPDEAYPGVSVGYNNGQFLLDSIIEIATTYDHPSGYTGDIICGIFTGAIDTEPDYFNYTLLDGRSGSFYWDPYRERYLTNSHRNFKITKIGSGSIDAIELIDDIGNIYLFGEYETSQSAGTFQGPEYRNAWYVSKVYNYNKTDSLSFGYSTETIVTKTLNPMRQNLLGDCPDNSSVMSTTTLSAKVPGAISFSNGMIEFIGESSSREDLSGSYALKEIRVLDNDNNIIKKFSLTFKYETGTSSDPLCNLISSLPHEKKRLFLKSFSDISAVTDSITYRFDYDTTIVAPCRASSAQDFWGYYNGRLSNNNLIPAVPAGVFGQASTIPGANRFIDTLYNQFGILKKLYYPTGGYTEYEYESHKICDTTLPGFYISNTVYLLPEHETTTNVFIDTITIYSNYDLYINNSNEGGSFIDVKLGDKECIGEDPLPNCAQFFIRGIDTENNSISFPVVNDFTGYHLKKGRYELKASFAQDHDTTQGFFMEVKWRERDTSMVNRLVGGLRSKAIKSYDLAGKKVVKEYKYTKQLNTDSSSGFFFGSRNMFRLQQYECDPSPAYYVISDNGATVSSHSGSYAGYDKVFEFADSTGGNGYSQFEFDQYPDMYWTQMPWPATISMAEFRGRLKNLKVYKNTGSSFDKVYEERNSYNYHWFDSLEFAAMKTLKMLQSFSCGPGSGSDIAQIGSYEIYYLNPLLSTLASKREISYNVETGDSLVNHTDYEYDIPYRQLKSSQRINSKGDTLKTRLYYPYDLALSGSAEIARLALIEKNSISAVLMQENYNNSTVTQEIKTNYKHFGGILKPEEMFQKIGSGTSQSRVKFSKYSNDGNLISQQKTDDIITSYIWDYNNNYPIAESMNADSASIAATSFEADGKGGWTYSGSTNNTYSITGSKSYLASGGNITKSGLASATYIVSYWGRSGSVNVNSAGPTKTGKTIGSWTYYEHEVTTTYITISGSNYIDELRLYPKGALMKTITYTPLVGITSECDATNRIIYYEYDSFNRLKTVKDEDGKILKRYDYKYQQTYQD